MKMKSVCLALLAGVFWVSGLFAGETRSINLEYRLEPSAAEIGPDQTLADLVISVKPADGSAARLDALLHITLHAPEGGVLIGTDFPIVEGTRLMQATGQTRGGELRLRYLFPIRGEYRLQMSAHSLAPEGASGHFATRHLDARFTLSENPGEVWSFIWMLLGLLLLGLVAGYLLGRDALSAKSSASAIMLLLVVLLPMGGLLPSGALHAHGPVEPPPDGFVDFVEVRDHGYRLRLKMLMHPEVEPRDAAGAGQGLADFDSVREQALINMSDSGSAARVGDVAYLVGEITNNGRPVPGARMQLRFEHLEDHATVFATESVARSEAWVWGQQFFDGAPHRVELKASMADGEELTAVMNVNVQGLSPPGFDILRALLVLLAVVASGMAIGYWLAIRRS